MSYEHKWSKKVFKPFLCTKVMAKCDFTINISDASCNNDKNKKKDLPLTVGPGVSDTDYLSENPGFWPNLVQMVSVTLKVTTIQNDPQTIPLGATRGPSIFYFMKIEGSKPAIYEWVKKLWLCGLKGGPKDFQKNNKKIGSGSFLIHQGPSNFFCTHFQHEPTGCARIAIFF